jgi:co-chaperonin GroES (HSP10)
MPLAIPVQTVETFSKMGDPAELKMTIKDMLGDLSGIQVMFNRILVAIYIRPEITKGGIIRPGSNVEEDLWQSKVGLVVKMGQDAFFDDEDGTMFRGQRVDVGDWAGFKIGDTWDLIVKQVPCRLIEDAHIRVRLTDPSLVF